MLAIRADSLGVSVLAIRADFMGVSVLTIRADSLGVSVFKVNLPCSGLMSAEVDVRMQMNINIFSASNLTVLNFKRQKVCLKG